MSKIWTQRELDILKDKYLITEKYEIEKLLYPRKYEAIRKKANSLNLFKTNSLYFSKDEEFYSKIFKKDYGLKRCDWYLNKYDVIVEYFGLLSKDYYIKKANEKN